MGAFRAMSGGAHAGGKCCKYSEVGGYLTLVGTLLTKDHQVVVKEMLPVLFLID